MLNDSEPAINHQELSCVLMERCAKWLPNTAISGAPSKHNTDSIRDGALLLCFYMLVCVKCGVLQDTYVIISNIIYAGNGDIVNIVSLLLLSTGDSIAGWGSFICTRIQMYT